MAWCRCVSAWLALGARFPQAAPKLALSLDFNGVLLEDWIDRLRTDGRQTAWLMQVSSKVLDKKGAARGEKLIDALAAPAGRQRRRGRMTASPATWSRATPW